MLSARQLRLLRPLCRVSFPLGTESGMPPRRRAPGRWQGWLSSPSVAPLHFPDSCWASASCPTITATQDHLRHPGMAKVEVIHFGLQTFNSHLSPRSQRCCYLNDLGNACVHQRQKILSVVCCACFALWNLILIYFKVNY